MVKDKDLCVFQKLVYNIDDLYVFVDVFYIWYQGVNVLDDQFDFYVCLIGLIKFFYYGFVLQVVEFENDFCLVVGFGLFNFIVNQLFQFGMEVELFYY